MARTGLAGACLCGVLLFPGGPGPGAEPSAPALTSSVRVSHDGSFHLNWAATDGVVRGYVLERREASGAPVVWYRGPATATAVSGLPDGSYRFRVRTIDAEGRAGPWCEPLTVTVRHHSLARAFAFFTVGALVFGVLLATIVAGHRRTP